MSNIPENPPVAEAPQLSADERRALRARAHALAPVVMIGDAGLSEAIITETDRALTAHGLIKVRVLGDDRDQRAAFGLMLCQRLACSLVQSIGKLLVLWRPTAADRAPDKRTRRALAAPKKLAAVGKLTSRRQARANAARVAPDTAPAPPRVAGLARRAGPGIRTTRGALNPSAVPRTRAEPGRAAPAPTPGARTPSSTRGVATGRGARPPGKPAAPTRRSTAAPSPKRSGPPAPRTRAGRSGR